MTGLYHFTPPKSRKYIVGWRSETIAVIHRQDPCLRNPIGVDQKVSPCCGMHWIRYVAPMCRFHLWPARHMAGRMAKLLTNPSMGCSVMDAPTQRARNICIDMVKLCMDHRHGRPQISPQVRERFASILAYEWIRWIDHTCRHMVGRIRSMTAGAVGRAYGQAAHGSPQRSGNVMDAQKSEHK